MSHMSYFIKKFNTFGFQIISDYTENLRSVCIPSLLARKHGCSDLQWGWRSKFLHSEPVSRELSLLHYSKSESPSPNSASIFWTGESGKIPSQLCAPINLPSHSLFCFNRQACRIWLYTYDHVHLLTSHIPQDWESDYVRCIDVCQIWKTVGCSVFSITWLVVGVWPFPALNIHMSPIFVEGSSFYVWTLSRLGPLWWHCEEVLPNISYAQRMWSHLFWPFQ